MEEPKLKEFEDAQGKKQEVAFECEINGRKFIITTKRKIFEKLEDSYKECTADDKETEFLAKYTTPAKSLDIDIQEDMEK